MRIGRIGTDHIQVAIRPAVGDEELLALVVRLEQLLDAGYGAIDVVFEQGPVSAFADHEGTPIAEVVRADGRGR